jgi:hypothetical protein
METTLIRGFVLFLALAGFGASSVSSVSSTSGVHAHMSAQEGGGVGGLCLPSSGDTCGMQ